MSKVTALHTPDFSPREVAAPGNLERLARRFLQRLEIRGYAANTVKAYRRDLEQFAGFLAARDVASLHAVTRPAIEAFADALLAGEGNSPRSVHRKIQTVTALFRFAVESDVLRMGENPLRQPLDIRWHKAPVEAPSEAAILTLINAIPVDDFLGRRDRAFFLLMYDAARRVSEVCGLNLADFQARGLITYQGKGGDWRDAAIEPGTVAQVEDWLAVRHRYERSDSPPALFLTSRGTRMSRSLAHQRIRHYGAQVGLPSIHCHLLRHRRLREIYRHAGAQEAQQQAGHAHLTTTMNEYGEERGALTRQRIRTDAPIGGRK